MIFHIHDRHQAAGTLHLQRPIPTTVETQAPVLIVEDKPEIAGLIDYHLVREGFSTRLAQTMPTAFELMQAEPPRLVLLGLMSAGRVGPSGIQAYRRLTRDDDFSAIPIIMIAAGGGEPDIVESLEMGADDCITTPFSPKVLLARVRAVLRRYERSSASMISLLHGSLQIDPARHVVLAQGSPVELTLTQYRLLHYLAARPGFVRSRDQITSAVRGEGTVLSGRVVDVHIAALRQKLGQVGACIETIRGVGYKFNDAAFSGSGQ